MFYSRNGKILVNPNGHVRKCCCGCDCIYANGLYNGSFECDCYTANPITPTSHPGGTSGANRGWALFGATAFVTTMRHLSPPTHKRPEQGRFALLCPLGPGEAYATTGTYQLVGGRDHRRRPIRFTTGTNYTFKAYCVADPPISPGGAIAYVNIQFFASDMVTPVGTAGYNTLYPTSSWTAISCSTAAASGAYYAGVYLMLLSMSPMAPVRIFFDNASLSPH